MNTHPAGPALNATFGKKGHSLITTTFYDKIEELRHTAAENPDMAIAKIRAYHIPEKYHAYILHKTNDHPGSTVVRQENTARREWLVAMGYRTAYDLEKNWPQFLSDIDTRRVTEPNLNDSQRCRWPTAAWYQPIEDLKDSLPPRRQLTEPILYEDQLTTRILEQHLTSTQNMKRIGANPNATEEELQKALAEMRTKFPTITPNPPTNNRPRRHLDRLEAIAIETKEDIKTVMAKVLPKAIRIVATGCDILTRTLDNAINGTITAQSAGAGLPAG